MNRILSILIMALVAVSLSGVALALPILQLDIIGGTYDTDTDDTVISSNSDFTLRALLWDKNEDLFSEGLTGVFLISTAIVPLQGTLVEGADYGTFSFDGVSYEANLNDMFWGTPPLDDPAITPPDDNLGPHGVFPTYFREFTEGGGFQFIESQTIAAYNVETDGEAFPEGAELYYMDFTVNVSGLFDAGVSLHIDLYNVIDGGLGIKAPYSHDATATPVPEPATLVLLGSGLLSMGAVQRRRKKKI